MIPLKTSLYKTHTHQEWGGFAGMNLSQLLCLANTSDQADQNQETEFGFGERNHGPASPQRQLSSAGFPKVMGY